jgi:predicted permease
MWCRRCLLIVRRSRVDDDLRDEIRQHIESRRQALVDGGMDPRDAAHEAQRLFGNATAIREQARDVSAFPSIETFFLDIRYGARMLRRSPLVTLAAILSLAIGIGATAGVFSLIDVTLVQRLAVRAPDELLLFQWRSRPVSLYSSLSGYSWGDDTTEGSTSFPLEALQQARQQARDVVDVFGFSDLGRVNLSVDGLGDLGKATAVSGNYFSALGLSPAQGRLLAESDDRADAPPVAVISDSLWKRRFGASPDAIEKTLIVNGRSFAVAGITPASFGGTGQVGGSPDVYVPLALKQHLFPDRGSPNDPNDWWVLLMGRVKPGTDPEIPRQRLDVLLKQTVRAARPNVADADLPSVEVMSGARGQLQVRNHFREPLKLMAIVVAIVLLVACANVANLLLARGRARARELSVRIALGASRRRIVRQLLTEGVILAICASALGLVASLWITGALLPALNEGPEPLSIVSSMNVRLAGFVAVLATVCVVGFALVPALRATDMSLAARLHEAGRGSATGRRRGLSGTLVVSQIMLGMVLVATALILVRSVRQLDLVHPGFDASHLLTFKLDPTLNGYTSERAFDLYTRLVERLRAAPGVEAASLSSQTLVSNGANIIIAARTDEPVVEPANAERATFTATHRAWRLSVDSGFFDTMRIKLAKGRSFDGRDLPASQRIAVVNQALARQLFNSDDVVGRQFRTESRAGNLSYEIVGVCADAIYSSLRESRPPTMYVAYRQQGAGSMTLEVRTAGDPIAFAPTAREIVRTIDANLPMFRVQSQEQQMAASVSRERLLATLATWLGGVALMLSAIGVYALLAYAVTLRTAEIGIRMALGAERASVRWMIVRQSLLVAALGLALGVAISVAGADLLAALVFNVAPRDSFSLVVGAAMMLAVTVTAGYIPARRASRVDPLIALRAE